MCPISKRLRHHSRLRGMNETGSCILIQENKATVDSNYWEWDPANNNQLVPARSRLLDLHTYKYRLQLE